MPRYRHLETAARQVAADSTLPRPIRSKPAYLDLAELDRWNAAQTAATEVNRNRPTRERIREAAIRRVTGGAS